MCITVVVFFPTVRSEDYETVEFLELLRVAEDAIEIDQP
jgi:hypothetical protein